MHVSPFTSHFVLFRVWARFLSSTSSNDDNDGEITDLEIVVNDDAHVDECGERGLGGLCTVLWRFKGARLWRASTTNDAVRALCSSSSSSLSSSSLLELSSLQPIALSSLMVQISVSCSNRTFLDAATAVGAGIVVLACGI